MYSINSQTCANDGICITIVSLIAHIADISIYLTC